MQRLLERHNRQNALRIDAVCPGCAGGTLLPYHLNESQGWSLSLESLREAVEAARAAGKCVRGLVFINPGNPTGQCLAYDNLRELIE